MAVFQFKCHQNIPASIPEIWDFISSPRNLKTITPDYMGFDIITDEIPEKMYPGLIIGYHVKPVLGIKTEWVTEITHVKDETYFVDEQRQGPYSMWHHEHFIRPIEGGVEMKDIISYAPPFGPLGRIANSLFIRKKIQEIFDYRREKLIEIFGLYE